MKWIKAMKITYKYIMHHIRQNGLQNRKGGGGGTKGKNNMGPYTIYYDEISQKLHLIHVNCLDCISTRKYNCMILILGLPFSQFGISR